MPGDASEPTREHAARWLDRGRAWLDEVDSPAGPRASSATGRFSALFGRDALWTTLLVLEAARLLPADRDLGELATRLLAHTLRALAATQGTVRDDTNEEQPGKIVHEYWPELPPRLVAANWPTRAGRYYGSMDATFLYLMTVVTAWKHVPAAHALIDDRWPSVRAALDWALTWGDVDGDGLIEVLPRQPEGRGLRNQVWKDSGDSVLDELGAVPPAPIAWLELQAYAFAAYRGMRDLLRQRDEAVELQTELADRAARLVEHLDRFWLPAERCPAMVLTAEKRPLPLVSSNIGHALWCGALPSERARASADRLLQPDLLTPWGLRTLSSGSSAFAPESYHRGSIWPFDNAVAAVGLWRMGRTQDARLVGARVLAALEHFDSPVELYCVPLASESRVPESTGHGSLTAYPDACAVQAWSAGALVLFAAQRLTAESP